MWGIQQVPRGAYRMYGVKLRGKGLRKAHTIWHKVQRFCVAFQCGFEIFDLIIIIAL